LKRERNEKPARPGRKKNSAGSEKLLRRFPARGKGGGAVAQSRRGKKRRGEGTNSPARSQLRGKREGGFVVHAMKFRGGDKLLPSCVR